VAKIATDARYSVAAIDLTTGESVSSGTGAFDTASVVKVDILAALLYQAQQDGRTLTASEQTLATAMIEHSDNTAATTLFNEVGGKAGLDALNTTFGLTDTVIGSNGNWGLTQTTAKDQIKLLQIVLGDRSVLTASSKAYAAGLMSNVEADQNFGVSAAADDSDDSALKVGYLQRSQTGLWDVTSVGRIESGGHTYLVAVLSDSNASFVSGVQLVDAAAKAAVAALA
jgi:beta-lactamase class A